MSWTKRALLSLALAVLSAAPAGAQIAGRPFEISGTAGYFHYDARARMKDGPAWNGALGWRLMPALTLEGNATFGPSNADSVAYDLAHNFTYAGLDLRWNLRPADSRVVPFVLTGVGYGRSHTTGTPPDKLERGAGDLGLGVLFNVVNQRTYVRLQARDLFFRGRNALEFGNHFAVTAGLHLLWGGKPRDQDLDGVRDWLDQCPNTPIGAKVDRDGCPLESDGDGVYDGLDKCPDTPKGCKVDKNGCPLDADGDGVCDGLDQCEGTPKGAKADAKGCPTDADGDGVFDGLDQCEGTLQGCQVDGTGCAVDSDRDGVCDGLDQCPNTPDSIKVDVNGCPIEVSEKETELLDTGVIRLRNINFDTGKADIKPESFVALDAVGAILQQYPALRIEIGGHTDNVGGREMNQTLSEARANAVLDYLKQQSPLLDFDQFTAVGYGLSQPLASNAREVGRALNRRVEFKVLNPEALKIEREKRRFLRKDEPLPPGYLPAAAPDTSGTKKP